MSRLAHSSCIVSSGTQPNVQNPPRTRRELSSKSKSVQTSQAFSRPRSLKKCKQLGHSEEHDGSHGGRLPSHRASIISVGLQPGRQLPRRTRLECSSARDSRHMRQPSPPMLSTKSTHWGHSSSHDFAQKTAKDLRAPKIMGRASILQIFITEGSTKSTLLAGMLCSIENTG